MTAANITIRISMPEDAVEVLRLKDATWLDAYPNAEQGISEVDILTHLEKDSESARISRWQGYLQPTDAMKNWIAVLDGKIVGFVAAAQGESRNEIKALYVLPDYQRQGIGSGLLQTALEWLGASKDIFLGVVEYNQPAVAAYTKAGFRVAGRSQDDPFVLPSGKAMPVIEMIK